MNSTNLHTYKSVDRWLGLQSHDLSSAWKRLRWSYLVYATDSVTELFNWLQRSMFRDKYNRWISRALTGVVMLPWWVVVPVCLIL